LDGLNAAAGPDFLVHAERDRVFTWRARNLGRDVSRASSERLNEKQKYHYHKLQNVFFHRAD